jgi:hypothetical protein
MKWSVSLSCAAVLVAVAGSFFLLQRQAATFEHLQDAKARLDAAGYFCVADNAHGYIGCGFLLSRNAVKWSEAGQLCKSGPMGPEWKGKVWVTLNPQCWRLESIPDAAGTRAWGAVVAFGDEDLLREIDELLSQTSFGIIG